MLTKNRNGLAIMAAGAMLLGNSLMATPAAAAHWHGGHWHGGGTRVFVGVGVGPVWGYPYWGYPYYYYPPPYYSYGPPQVVVQQPPTYVQQETVQGAPAQPTPPPQAFWYFCASSKAYYPSVQSCAEPWVKVPPRQE
jgi:hypothetical protein